MSDQTELSGDDCHFTIAPVRPVRVTVVPLPLQTVPAVGVAVPPTEVGSTVTWAEVELAGTQTPLCTTG